MIRTADDLVRSILADRRVSRPEQARMKNADDLVVVVVDGLTKTCEQPTSVESLSDVPAKFVGKRRTRLAPRSLGQSISDHAKTISFFPSGEVTTSRPLSTLGLPTRVQ